MAVYLVDEDYGRYGPWLMDLDIRHIHAETIGDGDTAFRQLIESPNVDLAILDVMLSAQPTSKRFTAAATDDYLKTGLALAKDLSLEGGPAFPARIVLLTNAVSNDILRAAEKVASTLDIPLWQKTQMLSPYDFGTKVQERLRELQESGAPKDGRPEGSE